MEKTYIHPSKKKTFITLALIGLAFYVIPLGFDSMTNKWYNPLKDLFDLDYLLYVFNTSMTNYWYALLCLTTGVSTALASVVATVLIPVLCVVSAVFYHKDKGKLAIYLQIVFFVITIITLIGSMFVFRDDPSEMYYRPTIFALILPIVIIITIVNGLKGIKTATSEKPIVAKKVEVLNTNSTTADELKKYKELLDAGAISQEEFDAKKQQLLNL